MLPIASLPDYKVGDKVCYRDEPDNIWTVLEIRPYTNHVWVLAKQLGIQQSFPSVVFVKAADGKDEQYKPSKDAFQKPRKTTDPNDPITLLMNKHRDLDAAWGLAAKAGLDVADIRARVAHLSPSLIRMNITNRLRKALKDGLFNPEDLL